MERILVRTSDQSESNQCQSPALKSWDAPKAFLALMGLTIGLLPTSPAHAVYGGTDATGSPLVLTLLTSKNARVSFCSMALLTERIVATAAHCVIEDQGVAPNLRWKISDMYVSQPGADVTKMTLIREFRFKK